MNKKDMEAREMKRQADEVRLTLQMCHKALSDLKQLERIAARFFKGPVLRDIYRGLRQRRANVSATKILVHSQNIGNALSALEVALRDGETILNQQAKYYEQSKATPRRVHPPIV